MYLEALSPATTIQISLKQLVERNCIIHGQQAHLQQESIRGGGAMENA